MKLFDVLYFLPAEVVVKRTIDAEDEEQAKAKLLEQVTHLKDREVDAGEHMQFFKDRATFHIKESDRPEGYGERPVARLIPTRFRMEVSDKFLPGYHDPNHRWNGWACPVFTFNQALDVMNEVNRNNAEAVQRGEVDLEQVSFLHYDPVRDAFMITDMMYAKDADYTPQVEVAFYSNGVKLYDIGSYNWCWTAESDVD